MERKKTNDIRRREVEWRGTNLWYKNHLSRPQFTTVNNWFCSNLRNGSFAPQFWRFVCWDRICFVAIGLRRHWHGVRSPRRHGRGLESESLWLGRRPIPEVASHRQNRNFDAVRTLRLRGCLYACSGRVRIEEDRNLGGGVGERVL